MDPCRTPLDGPRRPLAPPPVVAIVAAALAALAASLLAGAQPGRAATSPPVRAGHVDAQLVSAVEGTGDLATVPAGLVVRLDEGWKTYWRTPGEAGLPPSLDWAGSTNLAGATLLYPAPQRITVLGIQTFGYKHEVVFPLDLRPVEAGRPLDLTLTLDLLVCAEQCVPETLHLSLAVPAGAARPGAEAQRLARARAAVPGDARTAGMAVSGVEEVSDGGAVALQVRATADPPFAAPDVMPELAPEASFGAPRVTLSADRRAATLVLPLTRRLPVGVHLAGRAAVLTLTDGERALETRATVAMGTSAAAQAPGPSLFAMLGVALLGGLILNLMPCVLPVLSLKLVTVIGRGGQAPGAVRAGFLATAAGVVASFLAIAAALIALKAAGRTIGWGLQFQQPGFIAAMAVLVTVFACHLLGLIEVPLPRFVANAAAARSGPDESLAGHFVTGAFATLLATPCSAPFLGTAVGFALAADAPTMLAIFAALGLGLASPYLLVAAVPRVATVLPRPGRWMAVLKRLMAAPLALTAAWLVVVLAAQVGWRPALLVAAALVAVAALFAARARLPSPWRGVAGAAVLALAAAAVVLPSAVAAVEGAGAVDDGIAWRPFDRDRVRSLVAQGRTVFVDVTADWCLTCQANRRFVLAGGDLARRLNGDAVPMQADWTRPDASISAYLASYGRYGIPFNIVYGPGAPGGIVLPELLTAADVGAALDRAGRLRASALDGVGATPARPR